MKRNKENEYCAWIDFQDKTSEVYSFDKIEELAGKSLDDAIIGKKVTVRPEKRKNILWTGTIFRVSDCYRDLKAELKKATCEGVDLPTESISTEKSEAVVDLLKSSVAKAAKNENLRMQRELAKDSPHQSLDDEVAQSVKKKFNLVVVQHNEDFQEDGDFGASITTPPPQCDSNTECDKKACKKLRRKLDKERCKTAEKEKEIEILKSQLVKKTKKLEKRESELEKQRKYAENLETFSSLLDNMKKCIQGFQRSTTVTGEENEMVENNEFSIIIPLHSNLQKETSLKPHIETAEVIDEADEVQKTLDSLYGGYDDESVVGVKSKETSPERDASSFKQSEDDLSLDAERTEDDKIELDSTDTRPHFPPPLSGQDCNFASSTPTRKRVSSSEIDQEIQSTIVQKSAKVKIYDSEMYQKFHNCLEAQLRYKSKKDIEKHRLTPFELKNKIFVPKELFIRNQRASTSCSTFGRGLLKLIVCDEALECCTMDGEAKGECRKSGIFPAIHAYIKDTIWDCLLTMLQEVEKRHLEMKDREAKGLSQLMPLLDEKGKPVKEKKFENWSGQKATIKYVKNECGKVLTAARKNKKDY